MYRWLLYMNWPYVVISRNIVKYKLIFDYFDEIIGALLVLNMTLL